MTERGFTLVELLVAMMLMALLAAIATKALTSKAAAYQAAMRSDLRNLASAEEAYFFRHQVYASSLEDLGFQATPRVQVSLRTSTHGWSAMTEHEARAGDACAMYFGTGVSPYTPATEEGVMACSSAGGGGCSGR
ncbi:MAG: prepilin-type N-terminal cleavage/methylation domain-containing protein [Gemmatimonadota bacterium]|nr:MAG: prepilin-type N-terminal cleavage/methylation domain-containing protein [Gemmatimonadota bacterium]